MISIYITNVVSSLFRQTWKVMTRQDLDLIYISGVFLIYLIFVSRCDLD